MPHTSPEGSMGWHW